MYDSHETKHELEFLGGVASKQTLFLKRQMNQHVAWATKSKQSFKGIGRVVLVAHEYKSCTFDGRLYPTRTNF